MSRKREQARQNRINNRKAAGTYTAPTRTEKWFNALIESAHDTTRGNPAVVRTRKDGYAVLVGGAKGAGKELNRVPMNTSVRNSAIVHLCRFAKESGYHIVNRDWLL